MQVADGCAILRPFSEVRRPVHSSRTAAAGENYIGATFETRLAVLTRRMHIGFARTPLGQAELGAAKPCSSLVAGIARQCALFIGALPGGNDLGRYAFLSCGYHRPPPRPEMFERCRSEQVRSSIIRMEELERVAL